MKYVALWPYHNLICYIKKRYRYRPQAERTIETQRTLRRTWTEPCDPASLERGVRQLLADKVSGKPLLVDTITAEMMKNGVFLQAWISHFVLAPPLIISKDEIHQGIAALDSALSIADEQAKN